MLFVLFTYTNSVETAENFQKGLKGTVSRDFLPQFIFMIWTLINRRKYFWICFQFRRDILLFNKLRSVHHPAESDSTVCIIPHSQAPRCASLCGVKLRGVHPSAESSSKVCVTLQSQKNNIYKKLCGLHPTTESCSAVGTHLPWKKRFKELFFICSA